MYEFAASEDQSNLLQLHCLVSFDATVLIFNDTLSVSSDFSYQATGRPQFEIVT